MKSVNKRKDISILDKIAIIKAIDEKNVKRSDLAKQYGRNLSSLQVQFHPPN